MDIEEFKKKMKTIIETDDIQLLCTSKLQLILQFGFSKTINLIDYLEKKKAIKRKDDSLKYWQILNEKKFVKYALLFETKVWTRSKR